MWCMQWLWWYPVWLTAQNLQREAILGIWQAKSIYPMAVSLSMAWSLDWDYTGSIKNRFLFRLRIGCRWSRDENCDSILACQRSERSSSVFIHIFRIPRRHLWCHVSLWFCHRHARFIFKHTQQTDIYRWTTMPLSSIRLLLESNW